MGDAKTVDLRVSFDSRLKLKFLGRQITTDAGLLAYRELDETRGLTEMAPAALEDSRVGSNKQHDLFILLRQSIYSRPAGYEDVNDAERLAVDPATRHGVNRHVLRWTPEANADLRRSCEPAYRLKSSQQYYVFWRLYLYSTRKRTIPHYSILRSSPSLELTRLPEVPSLPLADPVTLATSRRSRDHRIPQQASRRLVRIESFLISN